MSDIRSGLIADAVEKDKVVKQIVQDAAYQIGLAAGSMIHLLAPDKIVLGGGLAEALPDLFKKGVNNGIEDWIMPSFKGSYEVEVAKLGDDSTVLGAAAYARTYFQNEKSPEKASRCIMTDSSRSPDNISRFNDGIPDGTLFVEENVTRGEPQTVAVIDIGTTSIRMEVAEIDAEGQIHSLQRLFQAVNLGREAFTRGSLRKSNRRRMCANIEELSPCSERVSNHSSRANQNCRDQRHS